MAAFTTVGNRFGLSWSDLLEVEPVDAAEVEEFGESGPSNNAHTNEGGERFVFVRMKQSSNGYWALLCWEKKWDADQGHHLNYRNCSEDDPRNQRYHML